MTRSNSSPQPFHTLWGPSAWAIAGVLLPIGLSYPSHFDPRDEPRKAAWEYLSDHYRLAYLLLPIALLALIVGLLALHDHTRALGSTKNSFEDGTALAVVGLALLLPGVLLRGLALPEYAQTYVLVPKEALQDFHLDQFSHLGNSVGLFGFFALTRSLARLPLHEHEAPLVPRWAGITFSLGLILATFFASMPGAGLLGYGQTGQLVRLLFGLLTGAGALRIAWGLGPGAAQSTLQKDAA